MYRRISDFSWSYLLYVMLPFGWLSSSLLALDAKKRRKSVSDDEKGSLLKTLVVFVGYLVEA